MSSRPQKRWPPLRAFPPQGRKAIQPTEHETCVLRKTRLGSGESGRSAFLARAVQRDACSAANLLNNRGVAEQLCKDAVRSGWRKKIGVARRQEARAVRALLLLHLPLGGPGCLRRAPAPFRRAHHAVMHAVPAAARGQTTLSILPQSHQRRHGGQAEEKQQQNGEEFVHQLDWSTKRSAQAMHSLSGNNALTDVFAIIYAAPEK
jgi:hypothetical protein